MQNHQPRRKRRNRLETQGLRRLSLIEDPGFLLLPRTLLAHQGNPKSRKQPCRKGISDSDHCATVRQEDASRGNKRSGTKCITCATHSSTSGRNTAREGRTGEADVAARHGALANPCDTGEFLVLFWQLFSRSEIMSRKKKKSTLALMVDTAGVGEAPATGQSSVTSLPFKLGAR